MPWNEITPMDAKLLFISDYLRSVVPFSALCANYGISRKTGYKWINRYHSLGLEGLCEQSRRPASHAHQIPYHIKQRIIDIRSSSRLIPGAKKIQIQLIKEFGMDASPSTSTINNILKVADLVKPRRRKRCVTRYPYPLKHGTFANDLWSVDFKGQFRLFLNGHWCYPLTIMDDYSRFLIGNQCQNTVQTNETMVSFTAIFREYGLPQRIRSDNGVPFSCRATAGISRLSAWWIRLGISPERITPGKPQQNGKHERMHRTLKAATLPTECKTLIQQQASFDDFTYRYNHERPHEALNQSLPAERYQPSTRPFPETLPEIEYPSYFQRLKVNSSGTVNWGNGQVYITHILAGLPIGFEEIDDGIFDVYFCLYKLGQFNIRNVKVGCVNYWTLNV